MHRIRNIPTGNIPQQEQGLFQEGISLVNTRERKNIYMKYILTPSIERKERTKTTNDNNVYHYITDSITLGQETNSKL